jgi:ABC-type nitrate/sulfonate/bicarbonate transport system ATPase subunit
MRRRVAIAAVFANKPEVPLMDEPFMGWTTPGGPRCIWVLVDLWTSAGNTVFFVTHNLEEALTLAARIIVLTRSTTCGSR